MTMKKKNVFYMAIFSFCCIFLSCDDGCSDTAIDYGTTNLFDSTKKMFDFYKDKKHLVLKNEKGDTLNFKIKYSNVTENETVANTFKSGKICTEEVYHFNSIRLILTYKDSNYYVFYLSPITNFDYSLKKVIRKEDSAFGGWLNGNNTGIRILEAYFSDPKTNTIPHKTVTIHSKNIEVIDTKEKIPEQVFIHEDKGIVAMIIPNHGSGYWVVDKIE